jgi:hypothetical protein
MSVFVQYSTGIESAFRGIDLVVEFAESVVLTVALCFSTTGWPVQGIWPACADGNGG